MKIIDKINASIKDGKTFFSFEFFPPSRFGVSMHAVCSVSPNTLTWLGSALSIRWLAPAAVLKSGAHAYQLCMHEGVQGSIVFASFCLCCGRGSGDDGGGGRVLVMSCGNIPVQLLF